MLRAVFFTVATVVCLGAAPPPPADASDGIDVFEADEAPEAAMKRQAEARKKAAARRKGTPEAPGRGVFRSPDERVRGGMPVESAAPPLFAGDDSGQDRDRSGKDRDDDHEKDHDDKDRGDKDHGDKDWDHDDDDGKKGKDGKG